MTQARCLHNCMTEATATAPPNAKLSSRLTQELALWHEQPSLAWPECCRVLSGVLGKQFLKETLGPLQSFLGEDDRFRLAARVGDVSLLKQAVHRIPVKSLPRPCAVVQSQVEKGKNRLIDLVRV